jgi:hypothetical protein
MKKKTKKYHTVRTVPKQRNTTLSEQFQNKEIPLSEQFQNSIEKS